MLEGVDINVAFAQRFVWQNVIIKCHQFNVQAVFFFCYFLRRFSNLLFCANDDAHFNVVWVFFVLTTTYQSQRSNQRADCGKGL
ncbi:hypothetical protein D3C72_2007110 [compost metagenome]